MKRGSRVFAERHCAYTVCRVAPSLGLRARIFSCRLLFYSIYVTREPPSARLACLIWLPLWQTTHVRLVSEFSAVVTLNNTRLLLSSGPTVLREVANCSAIKAATLRLSTIACARPIIKFSEILKFFFSFRSLLLWPILGFPRGVTWKLPRD